MNLADPELELIDPTPNIHNLFVHFDELFFWTKLMGRALVRWSKRMYSCAGICSYEGRNGLCDIALSEPLLKLRPRKDLVETLLHEMIHAYLFITNMDRDRDGHGPNFQAHMHRINKAAGLNISIYHDFHDEVKHYLTHWWRCNGRCQTMKPYFGIVRKSANRAPGPKDFWWNTHQKMCGGTFVKIKEPEKVEKTKKTVKAKPKADITKYITNNNNSTINKNANINKGSDKENHVKNVTAEPDFPEGIKKLVDLARKRTNSTSVVETVRNVWSDKLLQTEIAVNSVTETVRNVWANKQLPTVPGAVNTSNNANKSNWRKNKSQTVQIDSPPKKIMKIDDYFKATASSILKDVYGQEFIISQSNNSPKLKAIPVADSAKMPPVNVFVNCPNCNKEVYSNDINRHLDECLNREIIEELSKDLIGPDLQSKEEKPNINTIIQNTNTIIQNTNTIIQNTNTIIQTKTEIKLEKDKSELKTSVGTIQAIPPFKSKPDIHPKIENADRIIKSEDRDSSYVDVKPSTSKDYPIQKCPGCGIKIDIPLEDHLATCLAFFDNNTTIPEEGISNLETVIIDDSFNPLRIKSEPGTSKIIVKEEVHKCPCCGKTIDKPIEQHLDECLSFFDDNTTMPVEGDKSIETIVIDDDDDIFDESQILNATGTKSPCPCCMKMVEIADMNRHLDVCLSTSFCD